VWQRGHLPQKIKVSRSTAVKEQQAEKNALMLQDKEQNTKNKNKEWKNGKLVARLVDQE
jgi:Tfp pilus assembly protein FimT